MERVIWQYWETRGRKPAFIDGLFEIAKRNAGTKVIQVTPSSLAEYLPDLPDAVHDIRELAHKADMIRTRLIARYGGMWLDSDALVMRDLNWLFDFLAEYEFVGFNTWGEITEDRQGLSVNCFLSRPRGEVISRWVEAQNAKLEKSEFRWGEIGFELLDPICLEHRDKVKMLQFHLICPVPWINVRLFGSRWRTPSKMLDQTHMVMLSNYSLGKRYPQLREMTIDDILLEDIYLSHFVKKALDPKYALDPTHWAAFWFVVRKIVKQIGSKFVTAPGIQR